MSNIKRLVIISSLVTQLVPAAGEAASAAKGRKVYDDTCSSCHGERGSTEVPGIPNFATGERLGKTNAELKSSIKNGFTDPNNPAGMAMPPYGGGAPLTEAQIDDVLAYIRALNKK